MFLKTLFIIKLLAQINIFKYVASCDQSTFVITIFGGLEKTHLYNYADWY